MNDELFNLYYTILFAIILSKIHMVLEVKLFLVVSLLVFRCK